MLNKKDSEHRREGEIFIGGMRGKGNVLKKKKKARKNHCHATKKEQVPRQ